MSDSTFQPQDQHGQGDASALPPAGWYPDPGDAGAQRYWDGRNWTSESRRLQPAGWYDDPAGSGLQRYWDGNAWSEQTRQPQAAPQPQPGQYGQAQPGQAQGQAAGQSAGGYGGQQPAQGQQPYGAQGYPGGGAPVGAPPYYRSQGGFNPYGGPRTADGVRLAGWWARFGALIVDNIVQGLLLMVIMWVFNAAGSDGLARWWNDAMSAAASGSTAVPLPTDPQYGSAAMIFQIVAVGVGFLYSLLLQKFFAATLGQMLFGLRVVPVDHGTGPYRLSWPTALIRNGIWLLLAILPGMSSIFMIVNGLFPLFQSKRQTLHDLGARTQVVTLRP